MSYAVPSAQRYLDARVRSASQPELQLLMLDGALRFGRQARQLWDDESQQPEVDRLVRRTLDIVEELVRSVGGAELAESKGLEEVYAFIFRELTEAQLTHQTEKLDAAIRLLEFQRETWRLACEKLKAQPIVAPALDLGPLPTGGFSLQA